MQRYYFIDKDLDDLENVSAELTLAGIPKEQIYVLTQSEGDVDQRSFNYVWSILKKDTVRSALIGSVIGVCLSLLVLVGAWASGLPSTYTWFPFSFLAVIVLGFCTWEGGLWGIQEPHHEFRRFQSELDNGRHVLLVEAEAAHVDSLQKVCKSHPGLRRVGEGKPVPKIVRLGHIMFNRYRTWGP